MIIYNKEEFDQKIESIANKIAEGALFVYPTDTIYGIGCDATNPIAVKRLRELKERYKRPFSIIVPEKRWIRENCNVEKNAVEWITKIPGPYTLIFSLNNKKAIASEVNMDDQTIGIRMIDHWVQKLAEVLGRPIVTTSANKVGANIMTSLDEMDRDIKAHIDFFIDGGKLKTKPSTLVNLTTEKENVEER